MTPPEESAPPNPRRRWHDNRGDLSAMMDTLEEIPPELRNLIADAMTARADRIFQAGALLNSLKSLGSEKIMAIHKSQKKQRAYDRDVHLHKIARYFYILPEHEQEGTARQLLGFTELLVEYMANCDTFGVEAKPQELERMRDLFVQDGTAAVQRFFEQIHGAYRKALADELEKQIVGEEAGMRVTETP